MEPQKNCSKKSEKKLENHRRLSDAHTCISLFVLMSEESYRYQNLTGFLFFCAEQDDRSVDEIESNRCCNKRPSVAAAVDVAAVSLRCLSLCICSFHKLLTCAANLTEPINTKTMQGQNNLCCLRIIPKHYFGLSPSIRCLCVWLQRCEVQN